MGISYRRKRVWGTYQQGTIPVVNHQQSADFALVQGLLRSRGLHRQDFLHSTSLDAVKVGMGAVDPIAEECKGE
jgi:hypothetical protein